MSQPKLFGPTQLLALFWSAAALFDVGVLILSFTDLSPQFFPPTFHVFLWTVGNVVVQFVVSILLGLGFRCGWYAALVGGLYLLVTGTVTWIIAPVAGLSGALVLGWGVLYHGMLLRLLDLDSVRRGADVDVSSVGWLRRVADGLMGLGLLLLVVYLFGLLG